MKNTDIILGFLETIRKALFTGQISAAKVDAQRAFENLSSTVRLSLAYNGFADYQALADVRTLDALQKPNAQGVYVQLVCVPDVDHTFLCQAFEGSTLEEARRKAAAWVQTQQFLAAQT